MATYHFTLHRSPSPSPAAQLNLRAKRESLRQECWRELLEAARELPAYRHTVFFTGVLAQLLDGGDEDVLEVIAETIPFVRRRLQKEQA